MKELFELSGYRTVSVVNKTMTSNRETPFCRHNNDLKTYEFKNSLHRSSGDLGGFNASLVKNLYAVIMHIVHLQCVDSTQNTQIHIHQKLLTVWSTIF